MKTPLSAVRAACPRPVALILVTALLFTACGGGGGGGGNPGTARPRDLEGSLNTLGVDTAVTARRVAAGLEVPAGYSPLGAAPTLNKTSELLLFGLGLTSPALADPAIVLELTDSNGNATADVLHAESATAMPWAAEQMPSRAMPATLRAVAAGDFDGNGLDETAIVYQHGIETHVRLLGDQTQGFASTDVQIAAQSGVTNVAAVAGDLDGDGTDELVLGLTCSGQGIVQVWKRNGQTFEQVGTTLTYLPRLAGATLFLQLATGNLDLDRSKELAIAITEATAQTGSARFAVLDDLSTRLAVLREGDFTGRDQQNMLQVGLCVSVAIGDVDGDNIGEVLLGGLTAYARNCEAAPYFLLALDDATHGLVDIAGYSFSHLLGGCDSPSDPEVRTVHLAALDIDGDGRAEVLVNQFVFGGFATAAPWTEVEDWRLPDAAIWTAGDFGDFDVNTSSFVVGDFTGDSRDDIACYRQDTGFVDVWSLPQTATRITRVRHIAVPFHNSQHPLNSLLVPVNVDTDSTVLRYDDGQYKLVFTEPIVIAALAAPPAADGIGQNTGACYTAFGNTSTTVTERERSVTFKAGVSVGVNLDGGALTQSEFELKATMTVEATRTVGTAYELSKTIVFTSAPAEDTVVFTCVPVDRYTYTVLSHPDPQMVGHQVVVNLPRAPITLQAERGFYNRTVQPGEQQVGDSVFQHTIGLPSTYPTRAQKAALLTGGGIEIGPQSVGQGGGSTELTLQVGNSITHGGSLAVGFELSVEATAGSVLGGVTVGVEATDDWQITSGTSTSYTGVIGAIDEAHYAANRYAFGLFTYVHRAPGTRQQFQVLIYWVE
jgi:hypothetical protein